MVVTCRPASLLGFRVQADSARLTVQHGFGLRAGVRDGVGFVNDQCLFYLVGRYVAQYETQSQLQTFVYEQPASVKDISAAAISPNGKYLAVCEVLAHGKGTCSQLIVIFLPTRRAMRTLEHTVDGTVTCATFSHDSKLVACQLSGPENLCTVWHWEKAKQLGSFKSRTPVSRVRFNPEQAAMLSVSAPMRIVKANEKGNFKEVDVPALRKLAASEVQEHLWLSGSRLLVLTGDGLAHMFVSGEYSYASRWWHQPAPSTLIGAGEFALHAEEEEGEEGSEAHGRHSDWRPADGAVDPAAIAQASAVSEAPTVAATVVARPRSAQAAPRTPQTPAAAAHASPNCQITCASATAQGVLLGTSDGSALMLVEGAPGSRLRLAAAVRSDARQHSVLSIAISPSESDCLLLFGDHQLGMCSLRAALRKLGLEGNTSAAVGGGRGLGGDGAGLSAAAGDGAGGEEARAPMEFGYELLFQSIARGAISGLAAAASKPLFASCAEDGTVRVHSYTAPHATLITYTPEDGAPHSLALHPLGVQLALVQKDRVNLLDVGIDALWPSRELHADQASRAVYSTGGSYIAVACGSMLRVFSAYSGAPVAKMAGHTGPISAISWAANDLVLASAGADGMTYRWALSDGARLEEHHAKGNSYSAVALVSGVRMPHGRAEEGGHVDARTDRRNGDGSGDGLLEHELKGKDSHGLVDARRHSALVAVGTDSKLRLLCNGDVTELVVLQAASGGEGAAAGPGAGSSVVAGTASPPSTAGSGRPVNAAAASLSTQPAVGDGSSGASLVRFTCVAALHAHPIIFAGTLSGAIHVFSIEGRARDSSGGVGGAPGGADARSERRADGAQPAIGGGHGGQVRLSSSLVVPAAQRAGGAVAVLVAGSAGARAWQAHHGKVTRMAVTMDDCYLMSGSEDGSVFVFSVSLLCRGFDFGAQPVPLASLSLSDVVSVSRRTLDDLRTQLAETSLAAAERTLNVEAAVARETAAWREKADVKERAHAAAIARLERLIAEGQAARTAEALAFAKRMSAQAQVLDNKGREATSHLEGVLKLEIEATHALTAQLEAERKEAALQVQALQSQLAAERAAAADAAAAHRAALARAQAASAERADALLHAAEESTAMMEEEHDSEVARLRREAEDKQAVLHGEATQLRVERMVDRNQMKKGREKERALEAAVAENAAALSAAYAKIDGLERQLAAMHLAVEERERGLGERDTAYHQLSETATKLANSRDMLDSRIKELEVRSPRPLALCPSVPSVCTASQPWRMAHAPLRSICRALLPARLCAPWLRTFRSLTERLAARAHLAMCMHTHAPRAGGGALIRGRAPRAAREGRRDA